MASLLSLSSHCHNPIIQGEDNNALRWICPECKEYGIIRKDWRGVSEKREYAKVFRRDILQGNDNLFYKYNERFLRI